MALVFVLAFGLACGMVPAVKPDQAAGLLWASQPVLPNETVLVHGKCTGGLAAGCFPNA